MNTSILCRSSWHHSQSKQLEWHIPPTVCCMPNLGNMTHKYLAKPSSMTLIIFNFLGATHRFHLIAVLFIKFQTIVCKGIHFQKLAQFSYKFHNILVKNISHSGQNHPEKNPDPATCKIFYSFFFSAQHHNIRIKLHIFITLFWVSYYLSMSKLLLEHTSLIFPFLLLTWSCFPAT